MIAATEVLFAEVVVLRQGHILIHYVGVEHPWVIAIDTNSYTCIHEASDWVVF